ncbi:MAG: hypothetical protein OES25_09090 [Acidobacteriota bacterium]|nr:hypothetical protein [Acidobacteriota bacterium]
MGRLIATTVLALFSAGWVAPAFIAAELFRSGLRRLAVDNGLSRGETYFEDAERYLLVAAVWLAVAVGLWAFIGARRLLIPRPDSR